MINQTRRAAYVNIHCVPTVGVQALAYFTVQRGRLKPVLQQQMRKPSQFPELRYRTEYFRQFTSPLAR